MAAYSYQALDANGQQQRGIIDGESERQVRALLRSRQLTPIHVQPARTKQLFALFSKTAPTLPLAVLALVIRQLSALVVAGVPLDEALTATAKQSVHASAKALLLQLRSKVVAGQSLAASIAALPEAFPRMLQPLVRAGEQAGLLGQVLEQSANYLERRQQMQQQVKMAMIYPCVLILIAVLVLSVLMIFVLPDLQELFVRNGAELPLLTKIVMGASRLLAKGWWLLLIAGVLITLGMRHLLTLPDWQRRWHRKSLRLPVIGNLLLTAETARFSSTLSLLVQSGVPLVDALHIASAVLTNSELQSAISSVSQSVAEGGSLARALEHTERFPPLLTQMVASGESSGQLEAMLSKATVLQERELEETLKALVKLLEPLLLVVMAVMVGLIVMAVLLPILQMNTLVQ